MPTQADPFTSLVSEVPLAAAPLARVIAQVRFPVVASFARLEGLGSFQEALRGKYPILRPEQAQTLVVSQQGIELQPAGTSLWRFHDKEDQWRVSLATDFVAVETSKYAGREEFLSRLRGVLSALQASSSPAVLDRLGVRYVNRISGDVLKDLSTLVRSEVLGVAGTQFGAKLTHALSESGFITETGRLNARWGLLPKGATPDPTAIPPSSEDSWILDLDMFTTSQSEFDIDDIAARAEKFCSTIYSFFRWSVEDQFLVRFGGHP